MNSKLTIIFALLMLLGTAPLLIAQSTNIDKPTPLTSNIVSGTLEKGEKGRYYFYSVMAGPGEVNLTLTIGTSNDIFQAGVTVLDENEVALVFVYATNTGIFAGGQGNQILTLKRRQKIILQFGQTPTSSSGGDFRLRIGGAVDFGSQNYPSSGVNPGTQEVINAGKEDGKCLPRSGTLIIKMKDGSKKIIDLSEAETITVVP